MLDRIKFRGLLDSVQGCLAEEAHIGDALLYPSLRWREALRSCANTAERMRKARELFHGVDCDRAMRELLDSDDALIVLVEHPSVVRQRGNNAAHQISASASGFNVPLQRLDSDEHIAPYVKTGLRALIKFIGAHKVSA